MLRILFQLLTCAFLFAFNLYGASLIFYQPRLLKKAGLFLLLLALTLLAQSFQEWAVPARLNYMVWSYLVFVGSALSSLLVAAHRRSFQQIHRYQMATNPKSWKTMMKGGNFFFAHLFPAFLSLGQAMAIFH